MGYKRAKTIKLTWKDGEFEGLEVRVRRVSIAKFLELAPLLEADLGNFSAEDIEAMRDMFLEFGTLLVSWNLEEEVTDEEGVTTDVPVPCTPEAFIQQDLPLAQEIITQLSGSIAGVSAPLEQPSPSGEQSLAESLPMEVLSPSLAS